MSPPKVSRLHEVVSEHNGPETGGPVDMRDIRALDAKVSEVRSVQEQHGTTLVKIQGDVEWIKDALATLLVKLGDR